MTSEEALEWLDDLLYLMDHHKGYMGMEHDREVLLWRKSLQYDCRCCRDNLRYLVNTLGVIAPRLGMGVVRGSGYDD